MDPAIYRPSVDMPEPDWKLLYRWLKHNPKPRKLEVIMDNDFYNHDPSCNCIPCAYLPNE